MCNIRLFNRLCDICKEFRNEISVINCRYSKVWILKKGKVITDPAFVDLSISVQSLEVINIPSLIKNWKKNDLQLVAIALLQLKCCEIATLERC